MRLLSSTFNGLSQAICMVLITIFCVCSHAQEMEVEMGRSSPDSDDLLLESTPTKPHENVFIEDVEAQLKESKEEAKAVQLEIKKSEDHLRKARAKNYGPKKKQQNETIAALEKKKKADIARAKIEKQKTAIQKDVLNLEKKRIRAKEKAEKSEEAIVIAREKLYDARKQRLAAGTATVKPSKVSRKKKVKVNFRADAY